MLDRTKKEIIQAILLEINQLNIENMKESNIKYNESIQILCIMLNIINNWKNETIESKKLYDLCQGDKKMEKGYTYLTAIVD